MVVKDNELSGTLVSQARLRIETQTTFCGVRTGRKEYANSRKIVMAIR